MRSVKHGGALQHLAPMFDKLTISQITPQHIEQVNKKFSEHKPGTLWNALELLRRIINFGYKTNRCPALSFNIEMPIKDNEVAEYLTPEETQRFLVIAKAWPARDVPICFCWHSQARRLSW